MNVPYDKHIHSSLFKKKTTSNLSHDNKKKEKLKKIKKSILWYLVAISMICLIIVIERVVNKFITDKENSLIKSLQKSMNISYNRKNPPEFYQFISYVSDIRYFFLINTHIYIILYYGIDTFLATKIMFMHYIGLFLCYFLQILYKNPRPFWVDQEIVSYSCDGDFLLPNDFFFSYLFFCLYVLYNFRRKKIGDIAQESFMKTIHEMKNEDISFFHNVQQNSSESSEEENENEENWFLRQKTKIILLIKILCLVTFLLLVFFRFAIGVLYFEAVFMSVVYCLLYYLFVVFFDGYLEDFVKRSTIIISESKRYMFKWLIAVLLIECLSYILFISSENYSSIDWITNFLNCPFKSHIEVVELGSKALGYWFSFVSTSILFALIGSIFGIPKCYRLMNNVNWIETSFRKKVIRVLLASALLIPSWFFYVYFSEIMVGISTETLFINEYLAHCVHFFLIYCLVFGFAPYYIFSKIDLTNNSHTYTAIGDI